MIWNTWKPALALGAVLAATGLTSAGDRDTALMSGGPGGSTTMTLGGRGTAAQAVTQDTELAGHGGGGHGGGGHGGGFHGGYGGFHGGYGGYGYGGYYGGYRGYGGFYRPYYAGYYRPYYGYGLGLGYGLGYGGYGGYGYGLGVNGGYGNLGYGGFYSNYYNSYPNYGNGCGMYLGISGGTAGSGAQTIALGSGFARPVAASQPTQPFQSSADGTFPYDGGPIYPVPQLKADPQAKPPVTSTELISSKPKTTTTSKYKAYGEK
jgi:hypothetical protein